MVKAVQQAKQRGFDELTVKTDSMFLINCKFLSGDLKDCRTLIVFIDIEKNMKRK